MAGTDDTTALVQNPANLAFLPGSEFRWSAVFLDESNQVPWQGHAFALGFPLPVAAGAAGVGESDCVVHPPRPTTSAQTSSVPNGRMTSSFRVAMPQASCRY